MVFEHDSFRRGGQGELYLVQHRRRKKPEDTQRDADREAESRYMLANLLSSQAHPIPEAVREALVQMRPSLCVVRMSYPGQSGSASHVLTSHASLFQPLM